MVVNDVCGGIKIYGVSRVEFLLAVASAVYEYSSY
jgi:hypothetical protein